MANFAVIKNGEIDNFIIAESLEIATALTGALCVEIENTIGIGRHKKFNLTLRVHPYFFFQIIPD